MANTLIAYLKDGTQVAFNHAVDYRDGLAAGMLPHPPGTKVPKKVVEPEGEVAAGISAIAEPVVAPKKIEPVATGSKKKIARQ